MKHFFDRFYSNIVCILITAAICLSLGAVAGKYLSQGPEYALPTPSPSGSTLTALDKAEEIRAYLDAYFIGDLDETALGNGIAAGMLAGTGDRWSYYISAADYDTYVEETNNAYVGIGITIREPEEGEEGFPITGVTPNSPAEQSGVKAGDIIVAVEGEDALTLGMDEVRNRVRGEEGTSVRLSFLRDGQKLNKTITRASVALINITSELLPDQIGYIRISNFDANCARDTIEAIESLQKQGAERFIFDVRFNPGGRKDEVVALLDYLLPEGPLFISEDYTGEVSTDYSDKNCVDFDMVVLVNGDSYSAAEFFAAALREYEAAQVVGTQTCGKGYFQVTLPLSDGSAIALSVGKYRTPKGVSLAEAGGITPDQVVDLSDEDYENLYYQRLDHAQDAQLQAAIALISK